MQKLRVNLVELLY